MYPPYPHSMYGPPPPHYYHDPSGRYDPDSYGPPSHHRLEEDRKRRSEAASAARAGYHPPQDAGDHEEGDEDESGSGLQAGGGALTRLKTYIKPRIPSTQEVLDRRSRKNAQSRARAAKLRHRITDIEHKPDETKTDEEQHVWSQFEQRRKRKNDRSRERALEKKEEIDRILAKPEKKRTKIERQFLETALNAKKRKNEGDRLRRQRLKELGLSAKGIGVKPGVSARGPLPPQYAGHPGMYPGMHMHGGHPGDIPMSPLPTMPHHYPHPYPHSPGTFASPGMMSFSPQGRRPHGTPGRHEHPMPYMPPAQAYDAQSPGRAGTSSRVEQRRNPDGSISIAIGGRSGAGRGSSFGGEASRMPAEGSDEQDEMIMNENNYEGPADEAEQEEKA